MTFEVRVSFHINKTPTYRISYGMEKKGIATLESAQELAVEVSGNLKNGHVTIWKDVDGKCEFVSRHIPGHTCLGCTESTRWGSPVGCKDCAR